MRTLLLGVSTRSVAESAARCGQPVVAVDFFGDMDQRRLVETYALGGDLGLPLTAEGLGAAARRVDAEAVVYGANLENHPEVIDALAEDLILLGNPGDVVRAVRDVRLLREHCRDVGTPYPETLLSGEEEQAKPDRHWLVKRIRSGGGHGIRRWRGDPVDRSHILQARIAGRAASVAFVADGRECRIIGLTEQLIGTRLLGGSGFAWCGNLLPLDAGMPEGGLHEAVFDIVAALTRRFGLRGVNGADLVIGTDDDGAPVAYLVEVNPRFSASMELVDRAFGVNVFSLHLASLAGRLPEQASSLSPVTGFFGKGILYARRSVVAPDTQEWMDRGIRDVPNPGERIKTGHPVCTVPAWGANREQCLDDLFLGAGCVYAEIEDRREERFEPTTHLGHGTYA